MTAETAPTVRDASTSYAAPWRCWDQTPTTPEPEADGTIVVVDIGDDQPDYEVIFRDDKRAARYAPDGSHPDERWFDDPDDDGMTWRARLRYARAVHVVDPAARIEVTRDTTP